MFEINDLELGEEYFGESIGNIRLYQIPYSIFFEKCRSSNENIDVLDNRGDNTGLRIYSGCHVSIRLFMKLSREYLNFEDKKVIELGKLLLLFV